MDQDNKVVDGDSFEDFMAEMQLLVEPRERFPDEEKEIEQEGAGNVLPAKTIQSGLEEISEEEPWSPVRPTINLPPIAVDSEKESSRKRKPIDKEEESPVEEIRFESGGRKTYASLAAGDYWSLLLRDLRLRNVEEEDFEPQEMPKFTVETIRALLKSNFGFSRRRDFHPFGSEGVIGDGEEVIKKFLKTVKTTRILGLNTEGHQQKHPRKKDEDGSPLPLVMIALSNLTGTVLFFLDGLAMPEEFRELLSDVSICKIGSGMCREGEELLRIGIQLRGWTESGSLYRAFLRFENRTGLRAQCEYLHSAVSSSEGFRYCPYNYRWAGALAKAIPGDIPGNSIPHLQMNVRAPIAILCLVSLTFAADRKLPEDFFVFPVIWEALDLTRSKFAEELTDIDSDLKKNWIAAEPKNGTADRHRRLNNCRELTFLRRAMADFVEVYEGFYNKGLKTSVAFRLYLDPEGKRFYLPKKEVGQEGHALKYLEGRCAQCGTWRHKIERCPELPAGEVPFCEYDHEGAQGLKPHSILTCPILHGFCSECFMRGHESQAHKNQQCTQRELRQRFFMNQPKGLLTCIPLLTVRPCGKEKMITQSWKFGLLAQTFRRDAVSRFYLRIPRRTVLGGSRASEAEEKTKRMSLMRKIEAVKFNADLEDPLTAQPIPRYIIRDEIHRIAPPKRLRTLKKRPVSRSTDQSLAPVAGVYTRALGDAQPERRVVYRAEGEFQSDLGAVTTTNRDYDPEEEYVDAWIEMESYTSDEDLDDVFVSV